MAFSPVKKGQGKTFLGIMFSLFMLAGTTLAICDLSFALFQHLSFVNVLEKGMTFASRVTSPDNTNLSQVSFSSQREETLKQYIEVLLGAQGFNTKAISVNTKILRPGIIAVSIEKKYYSLFGFFNNIPISVKGTAFVAKSKSSVKQEA